MPSRSQPSFDDQLALQLPGRAPDYSKEAFLISNSNENAWRAAESWQASNEPSLILCGPPGSGKTHLAHLLASTVERYFEAPDVADDATVSGVIAIDNLPASDPKAFLNRLKEITDAGNRVVLAGGGHPGEWALGLKDLQTRLEAMPRAVLGEPDEDLIRAVIAKGFRDRQLAVPKSVVDYAAPRLPRTFAAAHAFVSAADKASLTAKKKISIKLAQKIIENLFEADALA